MNIAVAVCGNFEPEVRLVLDDPELRGPDLVSLLELPATCGRPPLTEEALRAAGAGREGGPERVDVIAGACCASLARTCGGCTVHRLNQCFYLVAPPALVDHLLSTGAYLVTPGWLAHWRLRLDQLGVDQQAAPAIFGESMKRVVLLDTGAVPGSAERLREFAAFVGLPSEIVPVGLEHLRLHLMALISRRRLETERAEALAALGVAHRRSTDYAAAFDLLSKLTEIAEERQAIQRALDVFSMLFAPRQLIFVSVVDGAPGEVVSRPPGEVDAAALLARVSHEAVSPEASGDGFLVPIAHLDAVLGLVKVEGIAAPEHLQRDLALALTVAGVCGLAINNAREYGKVRRAEEALATERERLAVTLHSIGDAAVATDLGGRIALLNSAAEALLGCLQAGVLGTPLSEAVHLVDEVSRAPLDDPARAALVSGAVVELAGNAALLRKDGTVSPVAGTAAPLRGRDGGTLGVVLALRDVSAHKRAERENEITLEFLRLVSASAGVRDMVQRATAFFQEKSGCEAVGVRLKEGDDFPYYEARGFPREFLLLENSLRARDEAGEVRRDSTGDPLIECMCGNVICGRVNPKKTFFSPGGSFWANSTSRLLATTTDADRQAHTRNRCNGEGYESVALMPLRVGKERLGLLQLNDRRKGMFTPEGIALWERCAGYLSVALAKARAEESLRASEARLRLLSSTAGRLLATEDPQAVVEELCREVMGHLDCQVFFNFLVVDAPRLRLNACGGIPDDEARKLEWLDYGEAVCGCVARDRRPIVAEDILSTSDPRAALVRSYGVQAYACHPLMAQGRLLGTLGFGTKTRARFTSNELELMRTVADQVATAMERVQGQHALRALNARLIEADRRKNEFLAMLSHELRNPLAPIRNSVYILERATPGGEQATRAREVIDRQAQHLTRLIDDLLDVTRISRGKVRLQRERVELNRVVRGTGEDLREVFRRAGIQLEVTVTGEPLFVDGDPTRIAQMVGNLLQNAAKFTHRGGHTYLSLELGDDGQAIIGVRDDGAGIQCELLPQLFEPFVQGDRTLDRSSGGLGLGLALVKGLAGLHGGSVSVESEGTGKGAQFTIRLPLETPVKPRLTLVASVPGSASRVRRVLVIEDNVDAAQSLKEVLELSDHLVEVAHGGEEGIGLAYAFHPDLIVCDIGLPGMDGYAVARALRSDSAMSSVFLVALTGYAGPETAERSRAAGFDLHLAKPLDMGALEKVLAGLPTNAAGRGG